MVSPLLGTTGQSAKKNAEQLVLITHTICFITDSRSVAHLLSDFVLDMLLSIQAAVKLDPDVICVCLPRAGATTGPHDSASQ